MLIAKHTLTMC